MGSQETTPSLLQKAWQLNDKALSSVTLPLLLVHLVNSDKKK